MNNIPSYLTPANLNFEKGRISLENLTQAILTELNKNPKFDTIRDFMKQRSITNEHFLYIFPVPTEKFVDPYETDPEFREYQVEIKGTQEIALRELIAKLIPLIKNGFYTPQTTNDILTKILLFIYQKNKSDYLQNKASFDERNLQKKQEITKKVTEKKFPAGYQLTIFDVQNER